MKPLPKAFQVVNNANRVVVRTFDMSNGKQLSEREYDFAYHNARELIQKHVVHCVNNGKGIQIFNAKDERK